MENVSRQNGQEQEKGPAPASPYDALKDSEIWQRVEKAILDLAANNDIVELTRRENIVGYICKQVHPLIPKTNA